MAERVASHPWNATPLGPREGWSRALVTALDIVLSSRQPMFIAWGEELTFLYNDAYADILANKHPDALGRPFREVWSDIWDDIEPLISRALAGNATWSENLLLTMNRRGHPEETYWTFSYSPVRDDDDRVAGMFCSCIETTAQVLAHLRSNAERQRLFEMSRDLFGVASFDGRLISINPAWSRTLGRPEDELLSRPFAEIIHPDDLETTAEVLAALERGEPAHQFFVRLLRADGQAVSFAWSAVPGAGPTPDIFYTVGRDMTEDLRREEMLRQSQKMEAVGQLTGGLAHDFNNLLAGISGSLELIQARVAQGRTAEVSKFVTAAQGAANRAAALTHRLLAFSRRQTLAPKPTDVMKLVNGMGDLIARTVGPQIELETINAAGLWPSLIDPNQLENAILNLCINARDAMPEGGKITIETANRWMDSRSARERGIEPGQYISVCVSDTGVGMPPEIQSKAFDPFFTTKPLGVGTGLGLSMIYGFAKQSGGSAAIYSEPGKGSMVCVYLPRHLGKLEEPDLQPERGQLPRGEGETVLVIDDEPTVRMLVGEVLSDLGYNAIEAEDGASGLAVLGSGARVDLLITDVGLPGGLNGRQVADAARQARPELKVLFITGFAENAVLSHGHLERGMHVMTKPFALDALATQIRELMEAAGTA
jgi:PAS domain S-box-containing protein